MGVKEMYLIHSRRVEKSYWRSPVLAEENITKQLILGLEQARDTVMPAVQLKRSFGSFVEDELEGISEGTLKLVAHPDASGICPHDARQPVTLIVGPEGGFLPDEMENFRNKGFKPVHMGPRILRVETAVCALISRLF